MTIQKILDLLNDKIKFYKNEKLYTELLALNNFKIEILDKIINEEINNNSCKNGCNCNCRNSCTFGFCNCKCRYDVVPALKITN